MAVAEARAVWQRAVNRCFVQEDAKRAPKLACCPSSSSSSKQVDAGSLGASEVQDNPIPGFAPLDRNPSYSNLYPDSKWWIHLQHNYGYQRGLTNEQSNTMETARFEPSVDTTSKFTEASITDQELYGVCPEKSLESFKVEDDVKFYGKLEVDPVDYFVSKQPKDLCFDSESPWIGGEKNEPWWRIADRDELASFVSQRSLDTVENCDLPQPQNKHYKRDPYARIMGCFDRDSIFTSSTDVKPQAVGLPSRIVHKQGNVTLGGACDKKLTSVAWHTQSVKDKPVSESTTPRVMTEMQTLEGDSSKAQLLEALCHSQTRAREAEKAAKQAYAEKEHIVKLFFRQASYLFAYKQWLRLLQLENLYFQIKNNANQPLSILFPAAIPWATQKSKKVRSKAAKVKRPKRGRPRYDMSKYAIAFAWGLSLVGAGLILGWTVGWMLPAL